MRYLLDTNVLSEPLKAAANAQVLGLMRRFQNDVVTAAPVWHELMFGCVRLVDSRKKRAIETYLQEVVLPSMPILPYDERAASWHADQRARLARRGMTPAIVDGQIAAIAAVNGLVLVTRNVSDFQRFEELQITDWQISSDIGASEQPTE